MPDLERNMIFSNYKLPCLYCPLEIGLNKYGLPSGMNVPARENSVGNMSRWTARSLHGFSKLFEFLFTLTPGSISFLRRCRDTKISSLFSCEEICICFTTINVLISMKLGMFSLPLWKVNYTQEAIERK